MPQEDEAARMFKILSSGTRLRMIGLLKDRALCVNALARDLGITPAAVSQHLRVLRDSALVIGQKRGNFVHYTINQKRLLEWNETAAGFLGVGDKMVLPTIQGGDATD
ncbi:MAG: ArsR/SmtB family transcription factor [Desulfobacteraceae bacterium]